MHPFQVAAIVISLAFSVVGTVLTVRAVSSIVGVLRTGQKPLRRTENPAGRTVTMVKETVVHTRMLQWTVVGIMHWFVYAGFIVLSFAVFTAYFQLFSPEFQLPLVGHFAPYEWLGEALGVLSTVGIVYLIFYRQKHHPRSEGRNSRFFRSTMWQAYFVEAFALVEGALILFIRGAEYNRGQLNAGEQARYTRFHFPISSFFGDVLYPSGPTSADALKTIIIAIAFFKIVLAMIWLITISTNLTMGVAWHRFTAWPNIWLKREPSGRTALGAIKPLTSGGRAITLDDIDDLDEDSVLGVGSIEDFSWKNMLDFTTCTECGRCQSQCPAWNTEKPLNPKLLITALRDHAYAKAPYLQAAEGDRAALLEGNDTLTREVERPLLGDTGDDWFYMPDSGVAVIDSEVLWNCTSCGACVQQCPVDIEHVDHIMDMRRYAVLVESNFPSQLNGLFKGLENKGNPWSMSSTARLDWAKDLDFEVKVVGEDIESLDEVDWLFWVGCAGAYEDRAKKTTRAVAELLDMAGISFGVLGNGETCTGDPARRAGNEFVFQGLAQENAETFKERKVKQVVTTCAHCFNTLKNEYQQFGVELEVTHHTQLLNRLVREGKLTPVASGEGAHQRSITYHDPCYIGRHNGVYTPPRELLQVLPGANYVEMERSAERSFCCGAGGAQLWMEEKTGTRINMNRTTEAVGTGADQIAVGCPFCRIMLSDGLTAAQDKGEAREEVEVLDVAQMLLASVKGEVATKVKPGAAAKTTTPAAPASSPAPSDKTSGREETKDEPEAGDVTQTEDTVTATQDGGPLAKASGGSSLFDTPEAKEPGETATPEKSVAQEAKAATPASSGGSLFDVSEDSAPEAPAAPSDKASEASTPPATEPDDVPSAQETDLASGGSLFDVPASEPASAASPAPAPAPAAKAEPAPATEPDDVPSAQETDLGSGGSLFDVQASEPAPAPAPTPSAEAEPVATEPSTPEPTAAAAPAPDDIPSAQGPATDLGSGSLFDIPAPAAPAAPAATPAPTPAAAAAAEPEAEPVEPEPEAAAPEPEAAPAPPAPAPKVATPVRASTGSFFDVAAPRSAAPAPAPEAAPEPAAKAEPAPQPETPATEAGPEPVAESTPDAEVASPADGEGSAGAAVTQATFATTDSWPGETEGSPSEAEVVEASPAAAEPETSAPAEAELETEEAAAAEVSAEEPDPAPAATGPSHTPKTDVDISASSSLFDL